MSGLQHVHEAWIDDLILGRLLAPRDAARLSRPQIEVIRAHIRSEILFSPEVAKLLADKAQQVAKELQGDDE
jgi:hypothetical protein